MQHHGGKTTQIASLTDNKVFITACERNRIRFDRLKYNLEKQGVKNFNLMKEDSRDLSDYFKFDKILLDTSCTGSGTESIYNESFSEELLERLIKVQENLLRKAINLVNSGGIIIYSTCSIFKDENEKIIEKMKDLVEIVPVEKPKNENLKTITSQNGTLTICPNEFYEGFFVSKLIKK